MCFFVFYPNKKCTQQSSATYISKYDYQSVNISSIKKYYVFTLIYIKFLTQIFHIHITTHYLSVKYLITLQYQNNIVAT